MTFSNGKRIETLFALQGPGDLSFVATSDDPTIPEMTGRFLNSDYEECVLSALLTAQKVEVNGVVTKLDATHGLSTKSVTETGSGKLVGVMQERIELISEDEFKASTR